MSIKVFIPAVDSFRADAGDRLIYESKAVSPRTLLRAHRIAKETKSHFCRSIEINGKSFVYVEFTDFCEGEYTVSNAEAFLKQLAA